MLFLVLLSIITTNLLIVPRNCFKSAIWYAISEQCRCNPQQAITTLDMLFQEGERFPWLDRFHPQIDLAEFDGHGVDVYTIDAATNDVTQGLAPGFRRWLLFACANGSKTLGDAMSGSNEKVAAAAGGITDFEVENGVFWIGFGAGFIENGIKG